MLVAMTRKQDELLEDGDGPYLVRLGNWLARSLDPTELSKEEALLLFMVLTRIMSALWNGFERELLIVVKQHRNAILRAIGDAGELDDWQGEDTDDDASDGPSGGNGSGGNGSGGNGSGGNGSGGNGSGGSGPPLH